MNENQLKIKPLKLWQSVILFGIPSIIFIIITALLIPAICNKYPKIPPFLITILSSLLVFIPLFLLSIIFAGKDIKEFKIKKILERLRIKKLSKKDWLWITVSFISIIIIVSIIKSISKILKIYFGFPEIEPNPPLFNFDIHNYMTIFITIISIPLILFNILAEELFWRGYIMPRQETQHVRYAWLVNSILWLFFHIFLGINFMIFILPVIIILPYVVYKRQNTLIGIIIHGLLNSMSFILSIFGIMPK